MLSLEMPITLCTRHQLWTAREPVMGTSLMTPDTPGSKLETINAYINWKAITKTNREWSSWTGWLCDHGFCEMN